MSIIHADPNGPTGKLIAAYNELKKENASLRSRLALAEKVVEYAIHRNGCAYWSAPPYAKGGLMTPCDCGLNAAIAAYAIPSPPDAE